MKSSHLGTEEETFGSEEPSEDDLPLTASHLVFFVFIASIFETQIHGPDFWLIQDKHEFVANMWSNIGAISATFIIFIAFLSVNERFEIGLFTSWIALSCILTVLNSIVYLDFNVEVTLFTTFLVDVCSGMNDLFLVPIVLLNGGQGLSNFILYGISWSIGFGIFEILLLRVQLNVDHDTMLLTILTIRTLAVLLCLFLRFGTRFFDGFNFYPTTRGLQTGVLENMETMPYLIIWSNIFIALVESITPVLYLGRYTDHSTGILDQKVAPFAETNIFIPLVIIVCCLILLTRSTVDEFSQDAFKMTVVFTIIATISAFFVTLSNHALLKPLMGKLYLVGSSVEICTFAVISDLMVHAEDVYALSMYCQVWVMVLSRMMLYVAAFSQYDFKIITMIVIVKLVIVFVTIGVFYSDTELATMTMRRTRSVRHTERSQREQSPDEFAE